MFNRPIHIEKADCVLKVSSLPAESIDLIVTDPPYGIAYKTNMRKDRTHRFASEIANDRDLTIVEAITPELYRVLKNDAAMFMFCAWKKQDEVADIITRAGFDIKNRIVWDKGHLNMGDLKCTFGSQYEVIMFATKGTPEIRGKRHSDIWPIMKVSSDKLLHQNQKPVPLLERAILAMSKPDDYVLDPFMGSGSIGVACLNVGRNFVGYEIDAGYYEVASTRLGSESAQGRLFTGCLG